MDRIPVVIDCDPGVDDSYAIAMANSYPGFDIKALTPVEGNVVADITRKNALCLREMLGIDCRVAFGAEKPLVRAYNRQAEGTHGVSGVGTVKFPEPKLGPDPEPAWDVIYEEAVKAKGKLVLFAVGPLTNIAITLRKHPDLPGLIDKFVIMGGGLKGNIAETNYTAEFNIWIDPTAAKEVFEKMHVYMVGNDACWKAALEGKDFDEMISLCGDGDKAYLVRELSKFSKKNSMENGHDNNVIYDALTVASVINPDLIKFEDHYTYVVDDDKAVNIGQTVVDTTDSSGKPKNCSVAMEVDKAGFVKMLKDMCSYYGSMK
ncbi:MAG: nucleoside hydrolase [Oscillospiraceae bacterium]|jgi:pyrimidine-specific ribonucleoside hydrolase